MTTIYAAIQHAVQAGMEAIEFEGQHISAIEKAKRQKTGECCILIDGIQCSQLPDGNANTCSALHQQWRDAWDRKNRILKARKNKEWVSSKCSKKSDAKDNNPIIPVATMKPTMIAPLKKAKMVTWSAEVQDTNIQNPNDLMQLANVADSECSISHRSQLIMNRLKKSIVKDMEQARTTADRKRKQMEKDTNLKLHKLRNTIAMGDEECKELTLLLQNAKAGWCHSDQKLSKLQEEYNECQKKLEQTHKQLTDSQKQSESTKSESTKSELESTKLSKLQEEYNECQKQLEQTKKQFEHTQKQLEESQKELEFTKSELTQTKAALATTGQQMKQSIAEQLMTLQQELLGSAPLCQRF